MPAWWPSGWLGVILVLALILIVIWLLNAAHIITLHFQLGF